jgi:hypothetical protein
MDIYLYSPWTLLEQVLALSMLVYACIRIRRHPGPSIVIIITTIVNLVAFFSFILVRIIGLEYDSVIYKVLEHVRSVMWFLSYMLLYIAVFGWRGKAEEMRYATAAADSTRNPLLARMPAVHVPAGWTAIVTISIIPMFLLPTAMILAIIFSEGDFKNSTAALVVWGLGLFAAAILVVVLTAKILYRAWTAIQDGQARTTPGRAVGYLFIPLFNLYWVFVAWGGLAKNFNAFLDRYQIPTRRLSEGLLLTYCVLMVVGLVANYIPFLGSLYAIAELVVSLMVLWSITGRVNDLHGYLMSARTTPPAMS